MNHPFYYITELLLIAAVPFLNTIGIKVPYWTIPLILITHFIQLSYYQATQASQQKNTETLIKYLEAIQKNQKDIISRQRDLKDDIMLGGYN